jgi:hypothetical protein
MSNELESSYTTLFGAIDHAEGNEARSVLSPTAYLVDLLRLQDSPGGPVASDPNGYHGRRSDVSKIPLDQANTFTEIPHLAIANEVMEARVARLPPSVAGNGLGSLFPPPLPFSEQHLRLKLYAEKLGTSLDELQRIYRSSVDARTSARLRLGLSQEEYGLFSTSRESEDGIKDLWGVADLATLRSGKNLEPIKKKLGLSLKELKQLVRQDLSQDELLETSNNAAASFFINPPINQERHHIVLDETEGTLRLENGAELENQHLDRMMRFVRLARHLDLALADLDWLIRTACGNQLDEDGLHAIAIAIAIRKIGDWPIDELCGLWSIPKRHGHGDDRLPADLFDRAFNNDFRVTLKGIAATLPVNTTADALDDRLQATLRLSGADFAFLKPALLAGGAVKPKLEGTTPEARKAFHEELAAYFSAFRRITKLSALLSLTVQELLMLLDVLGAQWPVSEHDDLSIPMPFSAAAPSPSPLALLLQPDVPPWRTMDVLQKLISLKEWLELRQLSARQLAFICLEDHLEARQRLQSGTPIDDVQSDDAIESALGDLYQALRDTMLVPGALQTGSLTANGARSVFESLVEARVLVTFEDDTTRGLLRVQPSIEELEAAMERGLQERLELHAGDFGALGTTDLDPLLSLLVSHGYAERFEEFVNGELEVHHFIAPGLGGYFSAPNGAATFSIPNFQEREEALFAVLAQHVDAPHVPAAALAATGIDVSDVPVLFEVLRARGHVEPISGSSPTEYRVDPDVKEFFTDPANQEKFVLPNFAAVFAVLAAKVEAFQRATANREVEAGELGERLAASSEQQARAWLRSLSGRLSLAEDLTELAFAWAFGTPDETMTQTLATLILPLFRAKERSEPALADAYLASRFRRLQQLALLLRKTAMSADEARVYLKNQQVHRRLPETLKVPAGFLSDGKVDALATLPNGDFLIVSGLQYAAFSRQDYHLLGAPGPLDQIPGVTLPDDAPDKFRTRVLENGLDAAFSDTDEEGNAVLHLCAGDRYVTVSQTGTSSARPSTDWGKVRNNIQDSKRVDAAVTDRDGRLFLFSGDQYFLYTNPQQLLTGAAFVDERYPRSIRGKFEREEVSPLPALMFKKVDAAFRDADDTYFFFSGNRFSHSTDPYSLQKIRPIWGHVLNYLFEESRVDAVFVFGGVTYLTRKDQLTRYSGAYQLVDEGYPISFGNIPESEPLLRLLRRFPEGIHAALAGSDGRFYAFKDGAFASSAAPNTSLPINKHWGLVRNVFVDNQRVDAALAHGGVVYLFCGDQYVRYSGSDYQYVDEGYPRRVRPNWNTLEQIGQIPDELPLPINAVAVGQAPGATADDVYFFGGHQYAGPSGTLGDIKAAWARVRNNIERTGVVDAAMLDGAGRMYLFSGDQLYRYSSPAQEHVDETYPRRLATGWPQEGSGYSLPDVFTGGISAALRTDAGQIFFFSGQSYARVDGASAEPPRQNRQDWGVVRNWIQANNQVGAAYVDPAGKTYLFGGDQFVRYSGTSYELVDEGYPLAISTRWSNIPEKFRSDINAALSFKSPVDNVQRLYLFKGDSYIRFSTGDLTQMDAGYPKLLKHAVTSEGSWFRGLAVHQPDNNSNHDEDVATVEATYVDTASGPPRIFVFYRHQGGLQWRRIYSNGNWQPPARMDNLTEYPFTRLDAAFIANDGTLYVFSGDQYASRAPGSSAFTEKASIRSRWARVENQFEKLGRVDACLSTAGGHTYLFCARQYIKYTGALRPGAADFYVDEGYPRRIDPNWPAEGVPVALAAEFQAAGYALCRDATGKIHFFNGARYTFSNNPGADVLLTSRWGKVLNRFQDLGRVDGAYRAENDKLYLFCDTQYTRYSGALEPGSPDFYADEGYPRRVTTGWASEGLVPAMPEQWNALGSAVFRDAQQTYVFSGASFISSQELAPTPVIPRWANVRNQLLSQNRVDAGFVLGASASAVTFLFCDDQYVRYSGGYTGVVDEGYPKVIAHLEAADGVFPGLPAELHTGLRAFFAGTDGQLHVFGAQPSDEHQPQLHVSSGSPGVLHPLNERWGIIDNKLWDNEFVNAALLVNGKLFLFSGDQYLRYSGTDRKNVDEGYPRKIASSYAKEIGVASLAPVLHKGIGAALAIGGTTFYFAGDRYVGTDEPGVDKPLESRWGLVDNRLQANHKLDAAFVAPSGKLYLFAGPQYSVYSGASRQYVDEEYPRTIAMDVGSDWPTGFTSDLDTAATFEGRSYLFESSQHVRISDFRLLQPDSGYPLGNAAKLVDRYDFELGTLPDWWRIKQLFDEHASQTTTLLGYLDKPIDDPAKDPVSKLARATRWPEDEIAGLVTIFSPPSWPSSLDLTDGRAIVRLARCFELANRLGTTPSRLKSQVWDRSFGSGALQLAEAADFLYGLLKVATSPKEWPEVARSLLDPVLSAKRDALVAYLVEKLGKQNADDLYEHLLTDVQMDASLSTSRVVEAINSIQLFYHRALIDLENVPGTLRADLKAWWPWMKNYRIWEANRKVFLHPENYIRPELRTEKSFAFEELEEKLLQDEITAITVQEGYQRYLESFNEIARLRIAGGYRYSYKDEEEKDRVAVFMIGYARTSPPTYYYRRGSTTSASGEPSPIDWEPWQKMGITIDAERVQLVYVFNKLFAFWLEPTPYNDTTFTLKQSDDNSYSSDSQDTKQVKLALKFSFYNFNNEWVTPQTVRANPADPSDPESLPMDFEWLLGLRLRMSFPAAATELVQFDVRNPATPSTNSVDEAISLTLRYFWWEWSGQITAGLDLVGAPLAWRFAGFSLTDPAAKLPAQLGIRSTEVTATIPWGSANESDPRWLSFDAKGGSFLCRPTNPPPWEPGKINGRAFPHVAAAFEAGSNVFVFTSKNDDGTDGKLRYFRYTPSTEWQGPVFVDDPFWPWGRPRGVFQVDSSKEIDNAVVAMSGTTYVSVGAQYFTYSSSGYSAIEQHYAENLVAGRPGIGALTGDAESKPWEEVVADGRVLERAFKHVDNQGTRAVLLSRAGEHELRYVTIGLDELRTQSTQGGTSPFDGWDGLDAVFQVSQPEPRAVFSRGKQLAILHWPDKSWSSGELGVLPGNRPRLSAAFTGIDGQLYFFSGDQYSEADPLALGGNQLSLPVARRWGRPSLFNWLVESIDGAMIVPDGQVRRLYLFCKSSLSADETYCLRYSSFAAADFDALVLDEELPKKLPELWGLSDGIPAKHSVTAAFERNGSAYLFGQRSDGQAFTARYSQLIQSPYVPDTGYPALIPASSTHVSTDLYAEILSEGQSYAITRLTSHTAEQFSRRLFAGGIAKLLSLETQQLPELPRFTQLPDPLPSPLPVAGPNELFVTSLVTDYPGKPRPNQPPQDGLDFESANGFYYREIFFHIPFLIAQALKQAQRFSEAMTWYEYVFDPTAGAPYWRFIEFLRDKDFLQDDQEATERLRRQLNAYRDDPFDPHKIAELRPIAYRKAFAMSYIDNLLEWGDMLFRQYTRESIGEATMLYVLAADLLGKKPEELGKRAMSQPDSLTYEQIGTFDYQNIPLNEELLMLENGAPPLPASPTEVETPNDSIFNPYFYIPENEQFVAYWNRVGDRLMKIRHGLDIDGVKRALALFAPPVDVMALVKAFASGAGLAQALAEYNTPVPHYRFSFMLARARELTSRLIGLGGALLAALEKKDAEELSLLRNTQEHVILEMQLQIKQQQLTGAKESLAALHEGLKNAQTREAHYQKLLADGLSAYEQEQVAQMITGQIFSQIGNVLSVASSVGYAVPQVGSPFAITYGGIQLGNIINGLSGSFKALAEMSSFQSSLAATLGGWERRGQDWDLQKKLATGDTRQIGRQIKAAEIQVEVARQEIQVHKRQIKNNESIDTFMRSKFTNQQLYQWMVGKLSTVYFQTYNLALQYAKAAQRAMQFELGLPESSVQYVGVGYWDSLKKGLLAGEQLQLDLDRLEKAHLETNQRRLEVTKYVSLARIDPLALVHLKEKGTCEFDLTEALFDYDFPGHYCRQLKSVSLSFPAVVGPYDNFNATLTQLAHRTLLTPSKMALKQLLQGTGAGDSTSAPATELRVDWRPNQQVALSRGINDSGLFQLNFQDERYLPFEGTGAVSTWRLEVNGVDSHRHRESLSDVILTVHYTALSGGDAFAEVVKSAVGKAPQERAWMLNLAYDFSDEWAVFMSKPAEGMRFAVERARLPGATGKAVTGVYLHYDLAEDPADDMSRQAMTLNGHTLRPAASKTGLALPILEKGQDPAKETNRWRLMPVGAAGARKFTPASLKNIVLVVTYSSKPSF